MPIRIGRRIFARSRDSWRPSKDETAHREAKITGEDLGPNPYGYPRAFQYLPESKVTGSVLDPTAGGGSIPFEAVRLGWTVCNDLNPVAALLLSATIKLPAIHRAALLKRYEVVVRRTDASG